MSHQYINPENYKLSEKTANLTYKDIIPNVTHESPETREFLSVINVMLREYIATQADRNEKVLEYHPPEELRSLLNLNPPEKAVTLQQLIYDCATTLKYCVKTGHPHCYSYLLCGFDVFSMAGEWLTATANANMFTYELAPVFILMESVVLKHMRKIIGWDEGDSLLAPGGSMGNLYALMAARHKMFPDYKEKGMRALPGDIVMFTSDCSHKSVKTCADVSGIGIRNCIMVPSDDKGRMIASELEKLIIQHKEMGHIPFFVNATAGNIVIGSFDPLVEIADVCERQKCWMHVDGAWGGALLLSSKYRHPRLTGIERADSVTWDAHYLMGAPNLCATIHLKEKGLFESCNAAKAKYLFMKDKMYDVQYDTGDKVIQCGRRNDIFKLWLKWRSIGDEGFANHIDRLMELAQYQVKKIKQESDKFVLVMEPDCVNVCFWYIPKRLRGVPHDANKEIELSKLCPIIKERMLKEGNMILGYQKIGKGRPKFFRSIIQSEANEKADVFYMLNEIDRLGEDL